MLSDAKKVFIGYSHDSPEHEKQVLALSERLRADGVDSWIDQYEPYPEEGWPRWMERQISEAGAVLLICTPTYRKRVEGREEPGIGKGVCWEANLIYNHLYFNKQQTSQFVPVLFSGAAEDDIPEVLRGQPFFRVQDKQGYESLYRWLTDQSLVTPGSLGSVRRLPNVEVVSGHATESIPVARPSQDKARKFFISYPQGDPRDENLARFLHSGLTELGGEEAPPLHRDAHGVIRVAQTRVTLESVISLFEQGASAEEIVLRYDILSLHDVYATLSYFLGHRQEMQEYLDRVQQTSFVARRNAERRSPAARICERLTGYRNRADAQSAG